MYITGYDNSYGSISNPMHVTWNGSGWDYPSVALTDKALGLAAFYPYDGNSVTTSVPMRLNPQTDYLASAEYIVSNQHPNVKFTMDHLLSCIKVNVDSSSDVAVTVQKIPVEATYDMKTQVVSPLTTRGSASGLSEVLIFPAAGCLSMDVAYNGKSYHYITPQLDFQKGKKYTFNLTVDSTEDLKLVGDVSITPWASGGDYDGIIKN